MVRDEYCSCSAGELNLSGLLHLATKYPTASRIVLVLPLCYLQIKRGTFAIDHDGS